MVPRGRERENGVGVKRNIDFLQSLSLLAGGLDDAFEMCHLLPAVSHYHRQPWTRYSSPKRRSSGPGDSWKERPWKVNSRAELYPRRVPRSGKAPPPFLLIKSYSLRLTWGDLWLMWENSWVLLSYKVSPSREEIFCLFFFIYSHTHTHPYYTQTHTCTTWGRRGPSAILEDLCWNVSQRVERIR